MWSRGYHVTDKKDNRRKLSSRQNYLDNTGYYDNRSFDDGTREPPLRYNGNYGFADGRNRNRSVSPQRRQSKSSEKRRCSLKLTSIFVAIATVVLIAVCIATGVVIATLNNDSKNDETSKSVTRQVNLIGDAILTDTQWSQDLAERDSNLYRQTENNFISDVDELFKRNSSTKDIFSHAEVTEFRPGSIRVIFLMIFKILGSDQNDSTVIDRALIDTVTAVLISSKKLDSVTVAMIDSSATPSTLPATSTISATESTQEVTTSTITGAATSLGVTTSGTTTVESNLTSTSTATANNTTQPISHSSPTAPNITSPNVTNQTTATSSTASPTACHVDEFQCVSDGVCIQGDWKCDDWDDCDDASDEEGCSACAEEEFQCSDGTCLPLAQKCDGVAQCTDFIDEENCPPRTVECSDGEFKCIKYQECINASKQCDGVYDCRDKSDEWLTCNITQTPWVPTDLAVRLIDKGQQSTDRGRVEVRRLGTGEEFGTVCGDNWSAEDALVVCRMINSSFSGTAFAYTTAVFGEGTGPILMTNVNCKGDESNIGHCWSQGFGNGRVHCAHSQDAGVSCDGTEVATSPAPVLATPDVRLVNGGTCLEGLLQVRHENEWRFVCDDNFESRDVTVACRMLGYNAGPGYVDDRFGIGDGVFWLDEVDCKGDEVHIANCSSNHWGEHDCAYYEAVGIVCGGEPRLECVDKPKCISNINCSFDTGDCCYEFPAPEVNGDGSTPWVRHTAEQIGQVDHTQRDSQGLLVYYRNIYGDADDFAYLVLPPITRKDNRQKLEFYYMITSPGIKALTLELGTDDNIVWQSRVATPEMDGVWTYGCWEVSTGTMSEDVVVKFVGHRGPSRDRVIALDDVRLTDGQCSDISTTKCDFDDFSSCGARIICGNCQKEYRWHLTNSSELFPSIQDINGYYIYTDASYGTEGDVTDIDFDFNMKTGGKRGLSFNYLLLNEENLQNRLEVSVTTNTHASSVWESKSSAETGVWHAACVNLPETNGAVTVSFTATRGNNRFGDMLLDDVEMIQFCKHPATCDFEIDDCGYEVQAVRADIYTWDHSRNADKYNVVKEANIRLVGGNMPYEGRVEVLHEGEWGTMCDDGFNQNVAMVICKELGYGFTEAIAFTEGYFGEGEGYIWIDEINCAGTEENIRDCFFNSWGDEDCSHSEDAGVRCGAPSDTPLQMSGNYFRIYDTGAPYGTWAQFQSPRFDIKEETYKISFKLSWTGNGIFQFYIVDEENNKYTLDESKTITHDNTDTVETICVDVNGLHLENSQLVFESTKGHLLGIQGADEDLDIVSIDDIDVAAGRCKDPKFCTFEADHRLCKFKVIDQPIANMTCEPSRTWKRGGGINDVQGIEDHTYGDKTGHYMSVSTIYGSQHSPAELVFEFANFDTTQNMTFQMFYKVLKETNNNSVFHMKIGNVEADISINDALINSWVPACMELTVQGNATITVTVEAIDVNVALDDVAFKTGFCPGKSANCTFDDSFLCGYAAGTGWRYVTQEGFVRAVKSGEEFTSPPVVSVDETTMCISTEVRGSHDQLLENSPGLQLAVRDISDNSERLLRHHTLPIMGSEWQTLNFQVPNLIGEYSIVWKVHLGDSDYLDMQSTTISSGDCSPTSCADGMFSCIRDGNAFCMALTDVCQNINMCPNAADTVCLPSSTCAFDDSYACGWDLYRAFVSEGILHDMSLYLGGEKFTYAETPAIEVKEPSCLIFTWYREYNDNLFRVLQNNSNILQELQGFSQYKSQGKMQVVNLELPAGNYSLVFESHHMENKASYLFIDNVSVSEGVCEQSECSNKTCNYNGNKESVCFPNDAVVCDKLIDCPYGTDEKDCDYSFDCDFDIDVCGYDLSDTITRAELPHVVSDTNVTLNGGSDTKNGSALVYDARPFGQVNFTTGPIEVLSDTCLVSVDLWTYKDVSFSPDEVFLYLVIDFIDELRRSNTYESYLELNDTQNWFTVSVPTKSFNNYDDSSGPLSHGRYLPNIRFIARGLYVAVDNVKSKFCNESQAATAKSPILRENTTTSNGLPDNFPTVAAQEDYVEADIIDNIRMTCKVETQGNTEAAMHWYKEDIQISRNSDIINQEVIAIFYDLEHINKYTVTMEGDLASPSANYSLEINRVSKNDAGVYSCKIELNGSSAVASVELVVKTTPADLTDDNCFKNTNPTCHALGFEKVTTPGPFGVSDLMDANLLLQNIEQSETFLNIAMGCKRSLLALQCGLYLPNCRNGTTLPLCRDHCESIMSSCPLKDTDLQTQLEYGCKLLPYITDNPQCAPISTGCGNRYQESSGRILSVNYPEPYPLKSECDWLVEVDPYHVIEFEIIDYDVGNNTGSEEHCGLYVDDNSNTTISFDCGQVPPTFVTSSNTVTLKFVTGSLSSGRGFNIKYKQVPVDACISYSGENNLTLSSVDEFSNLNVESCNTVKIYLQDARDTLVVSIDFLADGCVTLTGNMHLNETLCNTTTVHEYKTNGYVDIYFESSTIDYQITTYKITYVRTVEAITLDHYGRLQILSEGEIGTMCGNLDQTSANIICKSLNFGWPAIIEQDVSIPELLPRLASEVKCNGDEVDITKCSFVFDPLGNDECIDSSDTRQIVTCPTRTISCDFTKSTCGYQMRHHVKFSPIYGLYKANSIKFAKGRATSIPFSYSEGIYLHFEYIIRRGAVGDMVSINLLQTSNNGTIALWEWGSYTTYGTFKGCTAMPLPGSNKDELYQLVIEYTFGETDFIDPSTAYTGMKRLELSFEQCAGVTDELICSFEDLETCASFTFLENLACPSNKGINGSAVVVSRGTYSREEWIQTDHTYRNNTGHYLLIEEGSDLDFVDLTNISSDLHYFRFYFGINNGIDVAKNAALVLFVDDGIMFEAVTFGSDWTEACLDISYTNATAISLKFGDQQFYNTGYIGRKTASLGIDDISFTTLPCSYYLNCEFENDCSRRYSSVTENGLYHSWVLEESSTDHNYGPHVDATFNTINKGNFMRANFDDAGEGSTAVLQSAEMSEADDIKCISLKYFIHGNENPGTLKVTVDSANESETVVVSDRDGGDEWHVDTVSVTNKVRFIQFVAVKGVGGGTIAIDDVYYSTESCIAGLTNLKYCTFDDPVICGMDSDNDRWKQGRVNDLKEYVQYDADLNKDGHFFYIIPSTLSLDEEASIRFDVETNKTAFQFSYISTGGITSKLYTEIHGQREYVNVQIENYWVESECISLPVEFGGNIIIGIENSDTNVTFLAVDNVRLLNTESCIETDLTCDFSSGSTCNYRSFGNIWEFSNTFTSTRSGFIQAPVVFVANDTQQCFGFSYTVSTVDSVDAQPKLTLYRDTVEIWTGFGQVGSTRNSGQVTIEGGVVNLQISSEGRGLFKIYETRLQSGPCVSITDCSEFICGDKCLPNHQKCDRTVDCFLGEDEDAELCGFLFKLNFTNVTDLSSTGFQTPETSTSVWRLLSDFTLTVDGSQFDISNQVLVTQFTRLTPMPSIIESFGYHLVEDSCLQIIYFGDAASGQIQLRYQGEEQQQADIFFQIQQTISAKHISVPIKSGNVRVILYVYMINLRPVYSDDIRSSAVFAIKQITMHAGKICSNLLVECPDDIPNACLDKRSCYTDDQKCDLKQDCFDNSDELDDCGYGIVCNFEHANLCGYTNTTVPKTYWDDRDVIEMTQSLWERSASMRITRPPTDHTYQISGKGHFMTSKNHEGLLDAIRYVDVETMQSPFQTFKEDGCISFWYYLNSTGHQPKSTTAQIYVYVQYEDTMNKQLLWFDHINRPFQTWSQGGVHVLGNQSVRLIVTAKTSIPYDAYTGVVSFDDVDFSPGACTVTPLDCDDEMFQCLEDNVCIPRSMVCDGGPDCLDASDEQHCDRPDGALQLVGGDGTYGKLAYFHSRAWRPVCYPTTDYEQTVFKLNTAHYVCKELGFSGNSDAFSYRLWEKHSPTQIQLSCGEDGKCSARVTIHECDVFAYIRCSNDVCFPGERLCPGTGSTCVPESYFCDGQQDCPENMDEKQCLCFDGEDNCLHTPDACTDRSCESCAQKGMFECQSHQCIPLQDRCDGIKDCSDGTDEYRCVQIEKNLEVTVFLNTTLTRETVCVEDVNLEIAEEFCRLAGQGYVSEITSGIAPIEKGVTANDFIEKMNCYPLNLTCQFPECGTTVIQDDMVQPFIINGRDASIEEWPWYGVLRIDGYSLCGVSLIHPSWALAVSHCLVGTEENEYTVSFGTDTFDREGEWYQEIAVVKVFEYGHIPSTFPAHDIALLRLEHPVMINNVTRPICLPSMTSLDEVISRGTSAECYVVGLGATEKIFSDPNTMDTVPDVLQKKRVHIVSYEYCKQIWLSETEGERNFPTDIVCIATEGPSSPTCFGDSGSPLMCRADTDRWELIGAVSFGYGNCFHDLIPTVMTSVTKYNKWIQDTTGLN